MTRLQDLWREMDHGYTPFGTLRSFLSQLDDVFTEYGAPQSLNRPSALVPACDLSETDDHYVLRVDMPGVAKDDIAIEVEGNQLMVSGERKAAHETGEGRTHLLERKHGRFTRIMSLPEGVKADDIEADYKDGVLSIAVPKAKEAKRQRITIGESKGGILSRLVGGGSKRETATAKATNQPKIASGQ